MAEYDALYEAMCRNAALGSNPEYLLDAPWPLFLAFARTLTPQSYGKRIESWLLANLGWQPVPQADGRGDAIGPNGGHVEVKVTLVKQRGIANFVQIRPWQNLAGYCLVVISADKSVDLLWLSKRDMGDELVNAGFHSHGSTADRRKRDSDRLEFSLRITWREDSSVTDRWRSRYGVTAEQLATMV